MQEHYESISEIEKLNKPVILVDFDYYSYQKVIDGIIVKDGNNQIHRFLKVVWWSSVDSIIDFKRIGDTIR
jgi:hypothetical protein